MSTSWKGIEPHTHRRFSRRVPMRAVIAGSLVTVAGVLAFAGGTHGDADVSPVSETPSQSRTDAPRAVAAPIDPAPALPSPPVPSHTRAPVTRSSVTMGLHTLLVEEMAALGLRSTTIDESVAGVAECMVDSFFDEVSTETLNAIASGDSGADISDYEAIVAAVDECSDTPD